MRQASHQKKKNGDLNAHQLLLETLKYYTAKLYTTYIIVLYITFKLDES